MVFITATVTKLRQTLVPGSWGTAKTDLAMFFLEDCGRTLELWAGNAIKQLELYGLFFGSQEDKNTKSKADDEGLACEVSEGSKDSIMAIYVVF